jgi:hypothetical protein
MCIAIAQCSVSLELGHCEFFILSFSTLPPSPSLTKGDSMFKTASLQFGAYIEFVPTIYAYQKEACHVDATYASSL